MQMLMCLNRNLVDSHDEDEDFGTEIQDEKKGAMWSKSRNPLP
jgi:hypothetical protein